MNRDDIIRMAREAGWQGPEENAYYVSMLCEFAVLVRDHLVATDIHTCHDNCRRFACVQTRNAVKVEREACAKVCDDKAAGYAERAAQPEKLRDINPEVARIAVQACGHLAAAIRARGNNAN